MSFCKRGTSVCRCSTSVARCGGESVDMEATEGAATFMSLLAVSASFFRVVVSGLEARTILTS